MNMEPLDSESPLFIRLAREFLSEGRAIRFSARGASMSPFVCNGDILTVEPAREENLRVGDIVLYSASADRLVAHRLHGRIAGPACPRLLVRGDNQVESDFIEPAQVLGRVAAVERGAITYRPASWLNRVVALAATRSRRQCRILRARLNSCEPDHP